MFCGECGEMVGRGPDLRRAIAETSPETGSSAPGLRVRLPCSVGLNSIRNKVLPSGFAALIADDAPRVLR